jgi:hypothetical protein
LLQAKVSDDFLYRLNRKRFMDSLASLSSALVRMLDEPVSKQRAVDDINGFIVQNYLVVAHIAAIRLLLRRHTEKLPHESVNVILQQACEKVWNTLAQAQQTLDALTPRSTEIGVQEKTIVMHAPPSSIQGNIEWSGWLLLQRRTRMLHADADKIAIRSAAIGRVLGQIS